MAMASPVRKNDLTLMASSDSATREGLIEASTHKAGIGAAGGATIKHDDGGAAGEHG